jgi:putative transposase
MKLINPGDQESAQGSENNKRAWVTMQAEDAASCTFTAAGLPDGLSIEAETGKITGIPARSQDYQVTVTAQGENGESDAVTFAWTIVTMRAYRFALEPDAEQLEHLKRHCGAARWAYNFALERKRDSHTQWRGQVDALIESGVPEVKARKQVKVATPNFVAISAQWREIRGDARVEAEGVSPWWPEVSSYAISTGFRNADRAWSNWLESFAGKRKGARVGYPHFKSKARAQDSATLFHDAKRPSIRLEGYRDLQMPRIGTVRLDNTGHRRTKRKNGRVESNGRRGAAKRLVRMIERGDAVVQSVTVSRGGTRWYASVLVKLTAQGMAQREMVARAHQKVSKKTQQSRREVGVEWGVRTLAVLSDETVFENPRHYKRNERRLRGAARDFSRKPYTKGQASSCNRSKAMKRLGKVHHEIAEARGGSLHQVSAKIAISYPHVVIRDLNVKKMTRSAKGTREEPGKDVKVKALFNRSILDAAPGTLRTQLTYKTAQYGTRFSIAPIDLPSSQTCSKCGWRDTSIRLEQRTFRCGNIACGKKIDREVNAARNIRNSAIPVASDSGETLNACGGDIGPPGYRRQSPQKQEDRPPPDSRSFRRSDPPTFPHP